MAINVANFDRPSDMFAALYMGDWRMATWYKFPQGMDLSEGYTYIFNVFIDEITDHSRIGNFSDDHEGWINMLRYGEKGNKDTRLEDEGRGTYEDAHVSAYVQWVADEYNTLNNQLKIRILRDGTGGSVPF